MSESTIIQLGINGVGALALLFMSLYLRGIREDLRELHSMVVKHITDYNIHRR